MYLKLKYIISLHFISTLLVYSQNDDKLRVPSFQPVNADHKVKFVPFRLRYLTYADHENDSSKPFWLFRDSASLPIQHGGLMPTDEAKSVLVGDVYEEWVQRYASNLLPSEDYVNAIITDNLQNIYVTGVSFTTYSGADYFTIKYNKRGDTLWTRRYNGPGNGYDEATSIAVDGNGNVLVTGYSFGGASQLDYVTIKYRSDGTIDWIKQYNDSDDSIDIAVAVALDNNGGVYVTGYGYSAGSGQDIVTIKYNTLGAEEWINRYNSGANNNDRATTMCVDSAGNLHVIGYSVSSTTGADYLILNYDSSGVELWSDIFTSPGNGADVATSMTVDHKGNSYVTGYSYQSGTRYDYATLKYDMNGNRKWVTIYNNSLNGNDIATAIGVDQKGNVYVTGSSWDGITSEDYLTIGYDSNGSAQWYARYNGSQNLTDIPIDLVIDDQNEKVYVTGSINYSAGSSRDFTTIKFNVDGRIDWIESYNSPASEDDYATSLALDSKGNIYVAGNSQGIATGYDYLILKYLGNEVDQWPSRFNDGIGNNRVAAMVTDQNGNIYLAGSDSLYCVTVKYDSNGVQKWTSQFGQAQSNATGLVVDDSGNVYVTGYSLSVNGNLDYVTIKYNTDGSQGWVSWYNGTGNKDDRPVAIAIDANQCIYVTGTSGSNGAGNDYVTIKYNSQGNQLWISRYNGADNLDENAVSLALDRNGNTYVTGTGRRSGTSNDFLTVKYNSVGALVWGLYYNGTGNGTDVAKAIAVDNIGNIYVTGRSFGAQFSSDYVMIKYNPLGAQEWITRYNGPENNIDDPVAIVVDKNKDVYITGSSYYQKSGQNYTTIKYNSSGIQQWVRIYNGLGNGNDQAVALLTDEGGNVYVTGTSFGYASSLDFATVKYNSIGTPVWVARYNGFYNLDDEAKALAIDQYGYIYVAGNSVGSTFREDFLVAKYAFSGTSDQLWPVRANGPGMSIDYAKTLYVDTTGNVFVGGTSYNPSSSEDFRVVKYDRTSTLQWSVSSNGPLNNDDNVSSMQLDKVGNVYVTGTLYSAFFACDYGTVKFNKNGNQQWQKVYNGPADSYDFASGIAIDDSSNVFVTGYSIGTPSYDYATVKYNSAGTEQWSVRYNGAANADDLAYALGVDHLGNVYVTGLSYGISTGADFATIKYNSKGVEQWVARYDGPTSGDDRAVAMSVDQEANIYVTGWSVGIDTTYDIATIKYDANGTQLWAVRFSASEKINEQGRAITLDSDGNVYITGISVRTDYSSSDYITIKYDKNGTEQWHAFYDGFAHNEDRPNAIAVDGDGNVYVTGNSIGPDYMFDFATVKYDASGIPQWIARYSACQDCDDQALAISLDRERNVYVAGTSKSTDWSVMSTVKYSKSNTSVEDQLTRIPERFELRQNYPNPFNPVTNFQFSIAPATKRDQLTILKVFDLLGREVATLVNEVKQLGVYSVNWDARVFPSGVYFYRLQSGNFSDVKKMLLIR